MQETPVIDKTALELLFGDSEEIKQSILEVFSHSLVEYLAELEEASRQRLAGQLQAVAHKMKSSSRTVGAHHLADLCEALEGAGSAGDWERIEPLVPQFSPAIDDVRACINI